MPHTLPPYALPAPAFRFWHIASLAGRAPIGGAREVALACFVAARVAADSLVVFEDAATSRLARCTAARSWFGTLALPPAVRAQALRCADASQDGSSAVIGREIAALSLCAGSFLDAQSRGELDGLSALLRESIP